MKKLVGLLVGTIMMIATSAMATTITGAVDFTGNFSTDSNDLLNADQVIFQTIVLNPFVAPSGTYAPLAVAPFPTNVTFNPLTFNPSTAVSPLWSLTYPAINGITYSFDIASVSIVTQLADFLSLSGSGTLHVTGYDDTPGTWTFSSTGSTGSDNSFRVGFVSETSAVPEPGTMVLLGAGLLGLAIFGKRRMNKEA